jgi:hypothetical protein
MSDNIDNISIKSSDSFRKNNEQIEYPRKCSPIELTKNLRDVRYPTEHFSRITPTEDSIHFQQHNKHNIHKYRSRSVSPPRQERIKEKSKKSLTTNLFDDEIINVKNNNKSGPSFKIAHDLPDRIFNNNLHDNLHDNYEYYRDLHMESDRHFPKLQHLTPKINQQIKKANNTDKNKIENGWDASALQTLNNWYRSCKELSYCYQYILDKNRKISTKLSLVSIASSAILSIFAGFKLWNTSDSNYQSGSDAAMMISNFLVAAITTASKRYIDDQRNEKIRAHVENLDNFLAKIYGQIYIDARYRENAEGFIKDNMAEYTELIKSAPNLSIDETIEAKKNFRAYNRIEEIIKYKEQKIKEKLLLKHNKKNVKINDNHLTSYSDEQNSDTKIDTKIDMTCLETKV